MKNELEIIGKFLMKNFRDNSIWQINALLNGHMKSPDLLELQEKLSSFNEEEKVLIRRVCIESLDTGLHDFLFALNDSRIDNDSIELKVNGKDIAKLSEGLQGELFTEEGWIKNYSEYGE